MRECLAPTEKIAKILGAYSEDGCVMSWFKGLFGGKSEKSQSLVPLTDREYEQLFQQVLQGVAANWDKHNV